MSRLSSALADRYENESTPLGGSMPSLNTRTATWVLAIDRHFVMRQAIASDGEGGIEELIVIESLFELLDSIVGR